MVTKTKAYPNVAIRRGISFRRDRDTRFDSKRTGAQNGTPLNAINEIINGKKVITAETALQLEEVMPEIPARFWLNLETDFQLTKALTNKQIHTASSVREK